MKQRDFVGPRAGVHARFDKQAMTPLLKILALLAFAVAVAATAACGGGGTSGGGSGGTATNVAGATTTSVGAGPAAAPTPAGAPAAPEAVSAGFHHTCLLKDGGVWCWGFDHSGQVGDGGTTDSASPKPVAGMSSGVSVISAGAMDTCAVKDGGAWCWGEGGQGQLGNGATTNSAVPVQVPGMTSGVTDISAGAQICAVKNGSAYCWGPDSIGRHVVDPTIVPGMTGGVTAISAGPNHTCALKDGGVWCWGLNTDGQLGNNTTTDSTAPVPVSGMTAGVSAIAAGGEHSCALKSGAIWCWGGNEAGELGNGGTTQRPVPVQITSMSSGITAISLGMQQSCAVKSGGAWCWGSGVIWATPPELQPVAMPGMDTGVGAISISAQIGDGGFHTCVLKDGTPWCWGANVTGELGNGTQTRSNAPVPVLALPAASSATGPSPTPAHAATGAFDGAYVLVLPDHDSACGAPSISGQVLVIQGTTAAITTPSGDIVRGGATQTTSGLSVHIANQQNTWDVELTAGFDPSHRLAGQSHNSGIYPGGQQGFNCAFAFTGYPTLGPGISVGTCPDSASLASTLSASVPPGSQPPNFGVGPVGCWSIWVVAPFTPVGHGYAVFTKYPSFHAANEFERIALRAEVCGSNKAPPEWKSDPALFGTCQPPP